MSSTWLSSNTERIQTGTDLRPFRGDSVLTHPARESICYHGLEEVLGRSEVSFCARMSVCGRKLFWELRHRELPEGGLSVIYTAAVLVAGYKA